MITHLHFDHAGGLALLPEPVPIVIQRREWEAGQDADAIARNFFQPKDYEGVGDRVELVDGDHDLLATGRSSCCQPLDIRRATSPSASAKRS